MNGDSVDDEEIDRPVDQQSSALLLYHGCSLGRASCYTRRLVFLVMPIIKRPINNAVWFVWSMSYIWVAVTLNIAVLSIRLLLHIYGYCARCQNGLLNQMQACVIALCVRYVFALYRLYE